MLNSNFLFERDYQEYPELALTLCQAQARNSTYGPFSASGPGRVLMNTGALPRRCRLFSLTERNFYKKGQNTTLGRAGGLLPLRIMRAGLKSFHRGDLTCQLDDLGVGATAAAAIRGRRSSRGGSRPGLGSLACSLVESQFSGLSRSPHELRGREGSQITVKHAECGD